MKKQWPSELGNVKFIKKKGIEPEVFEQYAHERIHLYTGKKHRGTAIWMLGPSEARRIKIIQPVVYEDSTPAHVKAIANAEGWSGGVLALSLIHI